MADYDPAIEKLYLKLMEYIEDDTGKVSSYVKDYAQSLYQSILEGDEKSIVNAHHLIEKVEGTESPFAGTQRPLRENEILYRGAWSPTKKEHVTQTTLKELKIKPDKVLNMIPQVRLEGVPTPSIFSLIDGLAHEGNERALATRVVMGSHQAGLRADSAFTFYENQARKILEDKWDAVYMKPIGDHGEFFDLRDGKFYTNSLTKADSYAKSGSSRLWKRQVWFDHILTADMLVQGILDDPRYTKNNLKDLALVLDSTVIESSADDWQERFENAEKRLLRARLVKYRPPPAFGVDPKIAESVTLPEGLPSGEELDALVKGARSLGVQGTSEQLKRILKSKKLRGGLIAAAIPFLEEDSDEAGMVAMAGVFLPPWLEKIVDEGAGDGLWKEGEQLTEEKIIKARDYFKQRDPLNKAIAEREAELGRKLTTDELQKMKNFEDIVQRNVDAKRKQLQKQGRLSYDNYERAIPVWRGEEGKVPDRPTRIRPKNPVVIETDQMDQIKSLAKRGKVKLPKGPLSYPVVDQIIGDYYRGLGHDFIIYENKHRKTKKIQDLTEFVDLANKKHYTTNKELAELYAVTNRQKTGQGQPKTKADLIEFPVERTTGPKADAAKRLNEKLGLGAAYKKNLPKPLDPNDPVDKDILDFFAGERQTHRDLVDEFMKEADYRAKRSKFSVVPDPIEITDDMFITSPPKWAEREAAEEAAETMKRIPKGIASKFLASLAGWGFNVFDALDMGSDARSREGMEMLGSAITGGPDPTQGPLTSEEIEAIEGVLGRMPELSKMVQTEEEASRGLQLKEWEGLGGGERAPKIVTKTSEPWGPLGMFPAHQESIPAHRLNKYLDYMKGDFKWDASKKDWVPRTEIGGDEFERKTWDNVKRSLGVRVPKPKPQDTVELPEETPSELPPSKDPTILEPEIWSVPPPKKEGETRLRNIWGEWIGDVK